MYKTITLAMLDFILIFSCVSCDSTRSESILRQNENLFKNEFLNHSLLIRGNIVEMQIYDNGLLNDYFFEQKDKQFKLIRDTLQFVIGKLEKYKSLDIDNREKYASEIENIVKQLHFAMKSANVNSFTSEFYRFGIDLIINIEDEKLLYVVDKSKVTNPEWIAFLKQSKKIDAHWYLYMIPK